MKDRSLVWACYFLLQAVCLLMVALNSFTLVSGSEALPFTHKVCMLVLLTIKLLVVTVWYVGSTKGKAVFIWMWELYDFLKFVEVFLIMIRSFLWMIIFVLLKWFLGELDVPWTMFLLRAINSCIQKIFRFTREDMILSKKVFDIFCIQPIEFRLLLVY